MPANILFFPVDNGDMTLIEFESGRKILIDMKIRSAADDPDDSTPDVAAMLRERLVRDSQGRLYVDALLISHPDMDHCTGLARHFHLGPPGEWSKDDDKIFIREIWSSPIVFRRASRHHVLCQDAKDFNTEAKRRVARFREINTAAKEGDRILILGDDEDGKTDDLGAILIKIDQTFSRINGSIDPSVVIRLLAPRPKADEEEEEKRAKNHSSTILHFSMQGGNVQDKCRYFTCGDAEVGILENLWIRHQHQPEWLSYDILQTPHHCSWHAFSYDSWSEKGEDAKVIEDARSALSQARSGAVVVSSSKNILDDDDDPPCIRAKREYQEILKQVSGTFTSTGDDADGEIIEFILDANGPRLKTRFLGAPAVVGGGAVGGSPLPHG